MSRWFCILVLAGLPGLVAANNDGGGGAGDDAPAYPQFSGEVGLGFVAARGNTESSSTRLRALGVADFRVWRYKASLTWFRTEEGNQTTASRLGGSLQSDYRISQRSYLFANVNGERDRFGAFERRYSATLGIGRRFVDTETMELDLEVGGGRRYERAQEGDNTESEAIARLHGAYVWRFTPHSRLIQDLEVESGGDNTYTESETGLRSRLTESLSWTLSYVVQHNSRVPEGRESTDTFTTVTLDYSF